MIELFVVPDPQPNETTAISPAPTPVPKLNKKHLATTISHPKESLPGNIATTDTNKTQPNDASTPSEDNQTPKTRNPPQSASSTQPAEASASSQVTSSIPKPPNWSSMTVTQKETGIEHTSGRHAVKFVRQSQPNAPGWGYRTRG